VKHQNPIVRYSKKNKGLSKYMCGKTQNPMSVFPQKKKRKEKSLWGKERNKKLGLTNYKAFLN
jgi:hypothetical protein